MVFAALHSHFVLSDVSNTWPQPFVSGFCCNAGACFRVLNLEEKAGMRVGVSQGTAAAPVAAFGSWIRAGFLWSGGFDFGKVIQRMCS